jgi:hypothetical protein
LRAIQRVRAYFLSTAFAALSLGGFAAAQATADEGTSTETTTTPPAPVVARGTHAMNRRVHRAKTRANTCRRALDYRPRPPLALRTWTLRDQRRRLGIWKGRRLNACGRMRDLNRHPVAAIRFVFGPYGDQAVSVSRCETGGSFWVGSTNGQYLGLFQMGSSERSTYGHSTRALGQAQAAERYFIASGRDWSPWQCQPSGLAW